VEQFHTNRSVPVALQHGARSVDHLACLHPDDLAPLAASECAAVLLPGAEFMAAERTAPARELADAGAICVLATDANPGTSPVVSLPLVIGLAVRRYGWTPEAVLAATHNAACNRLHERLGSLGLKERRLLPTRRSSTWPTGSATTPCWRLPRGEADLRARTP
jgi:imidazolonepropionase